MFRLRWPERVDRFFASDRHLVRDARHRPVHLSLPSARADCFPPSVFSAQVPGVSPGHELEMGDPEDLRVRIVRFASPFNPSRLPQFGPGSVEGIARQARFNAHVLEIGGGQDLLIASKRGTDRLPCASRLGHETLISMRASTLRSVPFQARESRVPLAANERAHECALLYALSAERIRRQKYAAALENAPPSYPELMGRAQTRSGP
ncbi:MAG TPA: hypothetical protein VIW73_08635 [Candidatus Cybelea sp.]